MEDLDPPREEAGAADHILKTLAAWGLESDGAVMYQSKRHQAYDQAIQTLLEKSTAYRCGCSRKQVAAAGLKGPEGWRYDGRCRHQHVPATEQHCIRLKTSGQLVSFDDELQGKHEESPEALYGDFPIRRADGFYAYQLAVVVDDAEQGVTDIVRGLDIMSSTSRQIRLQQLLGLPQLNYCHLPLLVGANGQKLSKQNLAAPIPSQYQPELMGWVLAALGLEGTNSAPLKSASAALNWAIEHWDIEQLTRQTEIEI